MAKTIDILDVADLVPQAESVRIGDDTVQVRGIELGDLAFLFVRFPELRQLFDGATVDARTINALGRQASAALVAAATGHAGDEDAEAILGRLPSGLTLEIVLKSVRVGFPNGLAPVVELVIWAMAGASEAGVGLDMSSPSRPSDSSKPDIRKNGSGA